MLVENTEPLRKSWKLSKIEVDAMLGTSDEILDNYAMILDIWASLFALFQNNKVMNEWLRERHELIGNKVPLDLLVRGTHDDKILVHEFIMWACNR